MLDLSRRRLTGAGGVGLDVAVGGDGPLVVLLHGFPELASTWRHQVGPLVAAGHTVAVPDQRGYGRSDRPADIAAYEAGLLAADVRAIAAALGARRYAVAGHDWGALVAWRVAQEAPAEVAGVAGLSVPFSPRPPLPPTQLFRALFPDRFFYMLHFQRPGAVEAEFAEDPRRFLARMYWANSGEAPADSIRDLPREGSRYVDMFADPPGRLPGWLAEHLDTLVETFTRTGLTGPLSWYRAMDLGWERSAHLDGARVSVPALFITGEHDAVARFLPAEGMTPHLDDLRTVVRLPGVGHWTGEEAPQPVNQALLGFLASLDW